jgi:hypothetical protein
MCVPYPARCQLSPCKSCWKCRKADPNIPLGLYMSLDNGPTLSIPFTVGVLTYSGTYTPLTGGTCAGGGGSEKAYFEWNVSINSQCVITGSLGFFAYCIASNAKTWNPYAPPAAFVYTWGVNLTTCTETEFEIAFAWANAGTGIDRSADKLRYGIYF